MISCVSSSLTSIFNSNAFAFTFSNDSKSKFSFNNLPSGFRYPVDHFLVWTNDLFPKYCPSWWMGPALAPLPLLGFARVL